MHHPDRDVDCLLGASRIDDLIRLAVLSRAVLDCSL
jgi:hypothetical protein